MKYKVLGLFTVIAVILAGLVVLDRRNDGGGSAEGKPVEFTISPEQALAGQPVTIAGKVKPVGRSVLLERREGEQWVQQAMTTAGEAGAFSFSVPVRTEMVVYRVQAPRMSVSGVNARLRTSSEISLVAAERAGVIELAAPVGQSMGGDQQVTPGFVQFTPADEGAEVEVQSETDGEWTTFASGLQDAAGRFWFRVETDGDKPGPLRGLTRIAGGKPFYTPASAASPYRLAWRDEFSGSELAAHWQVRPEARSRPCTTTAREMAVVTGGVAEISAARDPGRARSKECPEGWLFNSQFTTEAANTFKYGTFAAKIKFQEQAGVHGGFFLYYPPGVAADVPASDEAGHRGAEIDTVEYFGEENLNDGILGGIQNSVYWMRTAEDGTLELAKEGSRKDVETYLRDGRTPADDFHVYSVEWTPQEYVFRFDGHETARIDRGISRREQFLYLSMLTSPFEAKYLDRSELPATMQVDWVRVWQR